MSLFTDTAGGGSPVQRHHVYIANDLQWIEGDLETLGDIQNYINREDTESFTLNQVHISPWSFTGLPSTRSSLAVVQRQNVQMLIFASREALAEFREPPHTEALILNTSLAVFRGELPFLSEARLTNFLDFWRHLFVPVMRARIHYLAPTTAVLPPEASLLYVNRRAIQSYVAA